MTRKTVTCVGARPKPKAWSGDEFEERQFTFLFSVTGSSIPGKPKDQYTVEVNTDGRLLYNWRLAEADDQELAKILLYYAAEHVQQKMREGTLKKSEEITLEMKDHLEPYCPVEVSEIQEIVGFSFEVDVPDETTVPISDEPLSSPEVPVDFSTQTVTTTCTSPGLPSNLNTRLRTTLLTSSHFDSDRELHTLFVDACLVPWRDRIPDNTPNREARVDALIDALHDKADAAGHNALALFLSILAEYHPADSLYSQLRSLATELDPTIPRLESPALFLLPSADAQQKRMKDTKKLKWLMSKVHSILSVVFLLTGE